MAAKGDVELQAQSNAMQLAAKLDVTIQSANAHVDWAAATSIRLATAAGAAITLAGGNITVQCPGTILVRAGTKSFVGPQVLRVQLDALPQGNGLFNESFTFNDELGRAFTMLPVVLDRGTERGEQQSDRKGDTTRVYANNAEPVKSTLRMPKIDVGTDQFQKP
jgi:uncharacterized protein (DUF2345 family)